MCNVRVFCCCSGDRRCSGGSVVRHPGGHVHRVPDAEERRGLVRAGRAEAFSDHQLVHQELESGVLCLSKIFLSSAPRLFTHLRTAGSLFGEISAQNGKQNFF